MKQPKTSKKTVKNKKHHTTKKNTPFKKSKKHTTIKKYKGGLLPEFIKKGAVNAFNATPAGKVANTFKKFLGKNVENTVAKTLTNNPIGEVVENATEKLTNTNNPILNLVGEDINPIGEVDNINPILTKTENPQTEEEKKVADAAICSQINDFFKNNSLTILKTITTELKNKIETDKTEYNNNIKEKFTEIIKNTIGDASYKTQTLQTIYDTVHDELSLHMKDAIKTSLKETASTELNKLNTNTTQPTQPQPQTSADTIQPQTSDTTQPQI